jgi:hypothetical protein
LESPPQVGVHLGGFVLYRHIVQELLNFTSFCFVIETSIKPKFKNLGKLGWGLGILGKPSMIRGPGLR